MPVLRKRWRSAHTYRSKPKGLPSTVAPPPPLSRNEAVGDGPNRPLQPRQLNREALSDRLAPLAIPQRTAHHPEHTVERSKHDSQTNPEDGDTRIDDEPLHHEAHGTSASVTTTRKPALGAHTTRVIERTRKRNTVAETHFQSDLSSSVDWYVAVSPCHAISHNVNTVLLQHAPNLFNLLLIHTTNTNTTINLTVTVLHDFKLKTDTVQTKNDFPAQ